MHRTLKRAVSIFSAAFLVTGILGGCGSSGTTAAVNDQTTSSATTAVEADHKAEVTLVSFAGKMLTVDYEGQWITRGKSILSTFQKRS